MWGRGWAGGKGGKGEERNGWVRDVLQDDSGMGRYAFCSFVCWMVGVVGGWGDCV